MIKILKEKTTQKILDEVQAKASARLMSLRMIEDFAWSKIKAGIVLNDETLAFKEWTVDSSVVLGDCKPYHAGKHGGLTIYPSTTIAKIRIGKKGSTYVAEVLDITRKK